MINTKDITVVVAGATDKTLTTKCLASIRKYLLKATIILSTWEGSEITELTGLYDDVILNKDPGSTPCTTDENSKLNNVNRQIVSTFAGIKKVKTKYALKFRTDFILTGNKFLKYFDKHKGFTNEFKNVSKKILSCTIYAINPHNNNIEPFQMHPSDFAFFGLKDDLYNLFDIPLMTDGGSFFFQEEPMADSKILYQYTPEQYIWVNFLKYKGLKHLFDVNEQTIKDTEISFANNLVLLSPKQLNIKPLKKGLLSGLTQICYTYLHWLKIYYKYCKSSVSLISRLSILTRIFLYSILCNPIFSINVYGSKIKIMIFFIKITIKT